MNKIIICGRLVRDPEFRCTNSGTEVCNFTVAVDRRIKQGEEKQADFINCTAWSKTGTFVKTYFHKGDGITVDGRMESRKYTDKEGRDCVVWGVTVDNIEFQFGKCNSSASPATRVETSALVSSTVQSDDDVGF